MVLKALSASRDTGTINQTNNYSNYIIFNLNELSQSRFEGSHITKTAFKCNWLPPSDLWSLSYFHSHIAWYLCCFRCHSFFILFPFKDFIDLSDAVLHWFRSHFLRVSNRFTLDLPLFNMEFLKTQYLVLLAFVSLSYLLIWSLYVWNPSILLL